MSGLGNSVLYSATVLFAVMTLSLMVASLESLARLGYFRALVDQECGVFILVWSSLLVINTLLGLSDMIPHEQWYIKSWIALANGLVSDLGDLVLAGFFCKVLDGMEKDLRAFPRAEKWARPTIYTIGGVLAALSVLGLISQARNEPCSPHRSSLWWAFDVFAYVYLAAVCVILVIAIMLKQKYNPSNREEYIVPFWTIMTVAGVLVRIASMFIFCYGQYLPRDLSHEFYYYCRLVDWVICIPVFIGIFFGSVRIGAARRDAGMVPHSLYDLGRRGNLYLS